LMHSGRVPATIRTAGVGPCGNPGYGRTRSAGSCTEAVAAASNTLASPKVQRRCLWSYLLGFATKPAGTLEVPGRRQRSSRPPCPAECNNLFRRKQGLWSDGGGRPLIEPALDPERVRWLGRSGRCPCATSKCAKRMRRYCGAHITTRSGPSPSASQPFITI